MDRFHVVVFNSDRIRSLLDNFGKIRNFRRGEDRLVIVDCSTDYAGQLAELGEFARGQDLALGRDILLVRRGNWGIDQGARLDYLRHLRRTSCRPRFIWQFQDHYLDLESPWSRYAPDEPVHAGELKGDTIPDNVVVDLDHCASVYEVNPNVAVIYADRLTLGVFTHRDGRRWFFTDGANFSVRADLFLDRFPTEVIDSYRLLYDGSYEWALFLEFEIGRRLTGVGLVWYDLVTGMLVEDPSTIDALEDAEGVTLHQDVELVHREIFERYEVRYEKALTLSTGSRRLRLGASRLHRWLAGNSRLRPVLEVARSSGMTRRLRSILLRN